MHSGGQHMPPPTCGTAVAAASTLPNTPPGTLPNNARQQRCPTRSAMVLSRQPKPQQPYLRPSPHPDQVRRGHGVESEVVTTAVTDKAQLLAPQPVTMRAPRLWPHGQGALRVFSGGSGSQQPTRPAHHPSSPPPKQPSAPAARALAPGYV